MPRRHPASFPENPGPAFRPSGRSATAGFTLVELLVATLLSVIVFTGWIRISNFQAIRKEALRRVALENAAGYLDFMAATSATVNTYSVEFNTNSFAYGATPTSEVQPMFSDKHPIGYWVRVFQQTNAASWTGRWAVVELYDRHHFVPTTNDRPFSALSIFLQ